MPSISLCLFSRDFFLPFDLELEREAGSLFFGIIGLFDGSGTSLPDYFYEKAISFLSSGTIALVEISLNLWPDWKLSFFTPFSPK